MDYRKHNLWLRGWCACVDLQVCRSCMLAWEIWPFLQAASSIGVLKKAYLLIEPY